MRTRFGVQLRGRRRHRHADRQRGARAHASASSSSTRSTPRRSARTAAERALTMLARASGAERQAAGRAASAARAACCSTRRAATGSRPTSSTRTRRCSAVTSASWSRRRSSRSSTTARYAREWGTLRDRRRRRARAAQRAHRGRRAHRLHVGPRARAQGGSREQRQRPARDLPAPADGAHDQHVPARRAPTTPTTIIRDTELRPLLRRARRRSGRTPRPATSCSASPRRT